MPKQLSNDRFSFIIGLLASLAVLVPLIGRIEGVPSIAAAMLILAAMPAIMPFGKLRGNAAPLLLVALAGLFAALVLATANADQWRFIASLRLWVHHADHYQASKLLMFLLYGGSGIVAALAIALSPARRAMLDGVFAGAVVVGCFAAVRTLSQTQIIATDFWNAREWYLTPAVSLTSYGTIFATAAIASIRWRYGWLLSSICLACAALLIRRGETLIIVAAMLAFAAWGRGIPRRQPLLVLCAGAILFGALHNSYSLYGFSNVGRAAIARLGLFESAFRAPNVDNNLTTQSIRNAPDAISSGGLGNFATRGGPHKYPHNILIETWVEIGALATVILALLLTLPLAGGLIAMARCKLKTPDILALGCFAAVLLISMKSGDLTSFGRLVFFAALAVTRSCFPPPPAVAPWPNGRRIG